MVGTAYHTLINHRVGLVNRSVSTKNNNTAYDIRADIFQLIHFIEGTSHEFIESVLNILILKYRKIMF